ncbi:unnamed protein product [Acanthocheilonema viteae]|uniref:FAD-binding domain-containing protein n=1 Tax=Acanthocheilonema viteae TaxID=6277 RepID=A0A498SGT0_ACAVI|nr:unnamed protein product [Acanthocheilonema viteae]
MISRICPLTRCSYSSTATTIGSFYDIIIIGGGMVGNAMACALGLNERFKSKKILVLDSAEIKAPIKNSPYGNRVTAVSPPSVLLFQKLGIWDDLVDLRVKRVDRLQVWIENISFVLNKDRRIDLNFISGPVVMDSCSHSSIKFAQPDATSEVAYMIENNAIIGFLSNRIKASCPNVAIKTKAKVVDCRSPSSLNEFAAVVLDDGTKLQTSLIVNIGADGARSMVRDMLKFRYTSWGYGQSAVVANLQVQAVMTWSTSTEHAEELLSLPPEEFVHELNEFLTTDIHQNSITNQFLSLTEQVLKGIFSVSEKPKLTFPTVISVYEDTRARFPLAFGHSYSYVIPRAALIGDAAHRTHPLAGQGVNLGWSDVKILLCCLEQCVIDGGDLGSLTYLSDYDTQAQRRNVPVQVICDWLNRLYLASSTPLILIRSLGLNTVDRFTPLKDLIVYRTST